MEIDTHCERRAVILFICASSGVWLALMVDDSCIIHFCRSKMLKGNSEGCKMRICCVLLEVQSYAHDEE